MDKGDTPSTKQRPSRRGARRRSNRSTRSSVPDSSKSPGKYGERGRKRNRGDAEVEGDAPRTPLPPDAPLNTTDFLMETHMKEEKDEKEEKDATDFDDGSGSDSSISPNTMTDVAHLKGFDSLGTFNTPEHVARMDELRKKYMIVSPSGTTKSQPQPSIPTLYSLAEDAAKQTQAATQSVPVSAKNNPATNKIIAMADMQKVLISRLLEEQERVRELEHKNIRLRGHIQNIELQLMALAQAAHLPPESADTSVRKDEPHKDSRKTF